MSIAAAHLRDGAEFAALQAQVGQTCHEGKDLPISVQLTEDGMVKVGKEDELVAFISQFPDQEADALTLEGVMGLPWVQMKEIKERQVRKYLDKAQ